ncbi:MAG: hypothetical protein R3324_01000, partial [Halobacteriales archaeon]|nr:hypothetical protein [Halobacteriales archaeon]
QNVPVAEGLVIFDVEEMVACRDNRDRGEIPAGSRLVAGLDPATAGYQAAVLWAYTASTGQIHLVDVSNQAGAGIGGWRDILREWWDVYGLTHWVVETNAAQSGYLDDTWVRDFRTRYSIHIEPHQTGSNKWDPHIGLTAMARMFGETYEHPDPTTGIDRTLRRITLPYGTPNAKAVTDLYIGQARHFSQNASASKSARKGYKSDVLMASWFPMRSIRRWKSEDAAEMDVEYEQSFSSFQQTEWNEVPWR